MNLTTGATLQNGRYVVQAILEESDWTTTYQATYLNLDQAVIIQTLGKALRDRPDFDQLRQQFLASVLRVVRSAPDPRLRVLDCFNETDSPFVVLEQILGQPLPTVQDWLPELNTSAATPPEATPADTSQETPASERVSLSEESAALNGSAQEAALSLGDETANTEKNGSSITPPSQSEPAPAALTPVEAAHNGSSNGVSQSGLKTLSVVSAHSAPRTPKVTVLSSTSKSQPKSKAKLLIPASLLLTSLVAGVAGATFGWTLRTGANLATSSTSTTPFLKPLFEREQSFPPLENWAGDDPVEVNRDYTPPAPSWRGSRAETEPLPVDEYEAPRVRHRTRQIEPTDLDINHPSEAVPAEVPDPAAESAPSWETAPPTEVVPEAIPTPKRKAAPPPVEAPAVPPPAPVAPPTVVEPPPAPVEPAPVIQ